MCMFDCCNSLLSHLPGSTIQRLQRVMNTAARVVTNLWLRNHVKPALKQLHWLPVEQRITYKLCLFMHHIHIGQAPQYLSDCESTVSAASGRYQLRSTGSAVYVLPRTRTRFGERGFFYSGPAAWNTLPSDLHDILTPVHPGNDLRVYCLIVLTTGYSVGAPRRVVLRRPTNFALID